MSGTRADARKSRESQPLAVLREADRIRLQAKALTALRRVYGDADWLEADALLDAFDDLDLAVTEREPLTVHYTDSLQLALAAIENNARDAS